MFDDSTKSLSGISVKELKIQNLNFSISHFTVLLNWNEKVTVGIKIGSKNNRQFHGKTA